MRQVMTQANYAKTGAPLASCGTIMPMTTPLGALVIARPEEVRGLILDAIRQAGGNRSHAARGAVLTAANGGRPVPLRTLHNWISTLNLWPAIDALCAEHGFAVQPGPKRRV